MSAGATDPATQLQGDWVLVSVAGAPVPEGAQATMNVDAGRFSFNLGCNTINAQPEFGPGFVYFGKTITTSMACPPDVADREAQLVEALASVEAMLVGEGDALAFYNATNGLAIGARRSEH